MAIGYIRVVPGRVPGRVTYRRHVFVTTTGVNVKSLNKRYIDVNYLVYMCSDRLIRIKCAVMNGHWTLSTGHCPLDTVHWTLSTGQCPVHSMTYFLYQKAYI